EERHMNFRLSRSMALRTILVVWVLIATAFAFMVTSQNAAAAARTNLVIGLQNDMVNLNPFDPGTNSVWKAYQTQYNFESLFTYDPNYQIYADLADPAAACPTGTTVAMPGSCVAASKLTITVNIRSADTPHGPRGHERGLCPRVLRHPRERDHPLGHLEEPPPVDPSDQLLRPGPGEHQGLRGPVDRFQLRWTRSV